MGKYLPIIIPVFFALLILIFGYFYIQSNQSKNTPNTLKEVPANLPDQTRIQNLEESVSLLVSQLNDLKSSIATASPEVQSSVSNDYKFKTLEASTLDLKARVSALEKPVPTPIPTSTITQKPPLYIPLGGNYSESSDQNWQSMESYIVSLDPAEYPGMTSAVLEVTMKLNQASGTGYARLYNSTDGKVVSGEASTASDKYSLVSTPGFTLTSGKKTYQLQLKSATGTVIAVQNVKIKINF